MEILVALVVLAILAALVIGGAIWYRRRSRAGRILVGGKPPGPGDGGTA